MSEKNNNEDRTSFFSKSGSSPTIEFLEQLFGSKEKIYFRALDPTKQRQAKEFGYTLEELKSNEEIWIHLTKLNQSGYNIYFVVNYASESTMRSEKTGFIIDDSISRINAVFVEIDNHKFLDLNDEKKTENIDIEEQHRRLDALPIKTSARIFTGGKSIHAYFFIKSDCSPEQFKEIQKRLAEFVPDADKSIHNPSRIMRLPEFNYVDKQGQVTHKKAELLPSYWQPKVRYTGEELFEKLPILPELIRQEIYFEDESTIIPTPEKAKSKFHRPHVFVPKGQTKITEGNRHKALRTMLQTYRKQYGANFEELLAASLEDNEKFLSPPKEYVEIIKLVKDTDERIEYEPDSFYWEEKLSKVGKFPLQDESERTEKIARKDRLLSLALGSGADLFCEIGGNNDVCYATVPVRTHYETYPINSKAFRRWLEYLFYENYSQAVSAQPMQDAINSLNSQAYYKGEKYKTFTRIGEHNGNIYYDLGDDEWQVVEITSNGWSIIKESPIKFIRPTNYAAQVVPVNGGNIQEFRRFINISDETNWILLIGWIIGSFRPTGAYPILNLTGAQDSAKSTTTKLLRMLIDPSTALVRSMPHQGRDLMVGAKNNWLLAFDNLSGISNEMSDNLCSLATGGGQANRKNFEDGEEYAFEAQRPVIMNGIEDVVIQPDLADRTVSLFLPSLSNTQRKTEDEFYAEYKEALPRILGAFFTVLSAALKNLPNTNIVELPRMADMARMVTAAESALKWKAKTFVCIYNEYQKKNKLISLENSSFGNTIQEFMLNKDEWEGSASDLLQALLEQQQENKYKRNIPSSSYSISNELRRLISTLNEAGIEVEMPDKPRKINGRAIRLIIIRNLNRKSESYTNKPDECAFTKGLM